MLLLVPDEIHLTFLSLLLSKNRQDSPYWMLSDPGRHHSSQPDGLIGIHGIILTAMCVLPSLMHFLSMKMPSLCLDMPLVLMKNRKTIIADWDSNCRPVTIATEQEPSGTREPERKSKMRRTVPRNTVQRRERGSVVRICKKCFAFSQGQARW